VLDQLLDLLARYGYIGVFVAAMLESLFPVGFFFPGSILILSAATVSDSASLNPIAVAVLAASGETVGQYASYAIGWYGGPPTVAKIADRFPGTRAPMERGGELFRRHGVWAVFVGRAAWGIKAALPVIAGASRMPVKTATLAFVGSSIYYYPALVALGYYLGLSADAIAETTGIVGLVTGVSVALSVVAIVLLVRRRPKGPAE
jgi:membrane protein DedA with SNARE-associated domain